MTKAETEKSIKIMGAYLKSSRLALKLTQEQVAERAGISAAFLRKIEHGSASVSWHLWLQIFYILELDFEVVKTIVPGADK